MAIDKKIRFGEKVPQLVTPSKNGKRPGYRGDDAYGSSSKSNQATSSRAATSSTNSSAPGGSSGQETRGDGPAPTTFQGNTQIVDTRFDVPLTETTIDPMDIREQYRIGNPINDNPFGKTEVTFNQPYMAQGLETNRYNNYLDSQNLKNYAPDPVNVPFMPLATKGLGILQQFGNNKNTQFFADNVAGKYGYGYGVEDYQQYMQDRVSGKVGAYGNEEQGQNALNERSGNLGGIESVVEVQNTGPVDYGPMEGMAYTAVEPQPGFRYIYDQYGRRSSIPIEGYTGTVNEAERINNDFNFGTYSNPIYSDDLV
jgi:hypothetical protein